MTSLSHKLGDSRHSLRVKLALWMLVIALALQLIVGLVVFLYQRELMIRSSNAGLRQRADAIAAGVRDRGFSITDHDLDQFAGNADRLADFERAVVALYTADGRVVASNRKPAPPFQSLSQSAAAPGAVAVRRVLPGLDRDGEQQSPSRYVVHRLRAGDGGEYVLLTAIADHRYESMIRAFIGALGVSVPIGALAAGVAGWLVAGLATVPILQLRRLAGTLSPEALREDVQLPGSSTEVAALQEDLREARAKLLQAFQAQDRFVSSVSHELKTPIAVLLTEAQTLRLDELPEDTRRFVLSVVEEMRRLGTTVESFLTLTKIRGGKTTLSGVRRCGINDAVMDAVEACNKMARQYKVVLTPELAESDQPLAVSGSPELLRVMIDNLIRNAIRFSPEHLQVLIGVRDSTPECLITVRDYGPGVSGALMDKVFDRFVQGGSEDQLGRGHGLGLSIAQGIAELHGGRISVRNVDGGGCEFTVRLPVAPPAGAAKSEGGARAAVASARG